MKLNLSENQQRDVGKYLHLISHMAAFLSRKSIQNAEYDIFGDGLKDLQGLLNKLNEVLAGERVMSKADNKLADRYASLRNSNAQYFGDGVVESDSKANKKMAKAIKDEETEVTSIPQRDRQADWMGENNET